jgi:hypothetical protein
MECVRDIIFVVMKEKTAKLRKISFSWGSNLLRSLDFNCLFSLLPSTCSTITTYGRKLRSVEVRILVTYVVPKVGAAAHDDFSWPTPQGLANPLTCHAICLIESSRRNTFLSWLLNLSLDFWWGTVKEGRTNEFDLSAVNSCSRLQPQATLHGSCTSFPNLRRNNCSAHFLGFLYTSSTRVRRARSQRLSLTVRRFELE